METALSCYMMEEDFWRDLLHPLHSHLASPSALRSWQAALNSWWGEREDSPDREKAGRHCWSYSLANRSNWEGEPCSGLEDCEARRKEPRSRRLGDTASSHQRVADREGFGEQHMRNWGLAGEDSQNSGDWMRKGDWDWDYSRDGMNTGNSKDWEDSQDSQDWAGSQTLLALQGWLG